MKQPQIIFDAAGQPAFAVIPWLEYERLANGEAEALLSDEEIYDHAKAEAGESFPNRSGGPAPDRAKPAQGVSESSKYDPNPVGRRRWHQCHLPFPD